MTTEKNTPANVLASAELIEIPASYAEFALAIGLSHDAGKGDVLAAMAASKHALHKLLAVVGVASIDEAIGKVTGERSTHTELVKAVCGPDAKDPTTQDAIAKLGAERKANERKEAEALILDAMSLGKTAGDGALGIFDQFGMGALKAHLAALPAHAALTGKQPEQKSSKDPAKPGASSGAAGKPVVVLSNADRKMIARHGRSEEEFIAARQLELEQQQAAHEDDED